MASADPKPSPLPRETHERRPPPVQDARATRRSGARRDQESVKHRSRWIIGFLVIGALALIVRNHSEPEQAARVIRHARPAWLLVALALQLATYPCVALIWTFVVRRARGPAPRIDKLVGLSVAELFTDQTLPSGGMSGTILVVSSLKKRGVPKQAAVAAVVSSLVGFYVAQLVAVIAAVVLLGLHHFGGWEATASVIAFVGALVVPIPLVVTLTGALAKLPKRVQRIRAVAQIRDHVADAPRAVVFSAPVLAVSTAMRFAVLILDGATLAVSLAAVGSPQSFPHVVAAFVLAYVVGSATFLPGGIGTFEVASTTLLTNVGAPFPAAAAATLVMRGLSFWLPMIPGVWFARREVKRDAST